MVIQVVEIEGKRYTVTGLKKGNKHYVKVGDKTFVIDPGEVDLKSPYRPPSSVQINDETRKVKLIKEDGKGIVLKLNGRTYESKFLGSYALKPPKAQIIGMPHEETRPSISTGKTTKEGEITAPMPGKIVKLYVEKDNEVNLGDRLCVLEAMKMENEITASKTGTIEDVYVKEGQSVKQDEPIVKIK